MAENVYEGMFILDSGRYGRDPEAVSGRITKTIQGAGGQMLVSRLWEERRLAYPIKGHRRGTYWLTYFRLDSSRLIEIKRECQLNENILRKLFLKIEPRIVDTLVEHAQAVPGAPSAKGKNDGPTAKGDAKGDAKVEAKGEAKVDAKGDAKVTEDGDREESDSPKTAD